MLAPIISYSVNSVGMVSSSEECGHHRKVFTQGLHLGDNFSLKIFVNLTGAETIVPQNLCPKDTLYAFYPAIMLKHSRD